MEKKTEKEEKYMKELQDRYIRFDWAIKPTPAKSEFRSARRLSYRVLGRADQD